jgi:hypothetical protein
MYPTLLRYLLLPMALLGPVFLFAQLGLRLTQLRPTGELGVTMEKKISAELLFIEDFEEDWRSRASLGYFALQPRLAVFPISGSIYDGQGFKVVAGEQSFSKWNMLFFTVGMDRALARLADEKLTPYAGLDVLVGAVSTEYTSHMPGISDEYFSGGYWFGGIRARVGVDYAITDELGVFLETCRAYYIAQEVGGLNHNDIGLGARYTF